MIRLMRQNLAAMPTPPVPRGFVVLAPLPQGLTATEQAAIITCLLWAGSLSAILFVYQTN
jgi:hypothetical protein